MSKQSAYKILGLEPGAEEKAIKKAYWSLAKIYHPDKNKSPDAARKFTELTAAYEELIKGKSIPYTRDESYARAAEIIRQEKEKARERSKRAEKIQKEKEESFRKSELYDLILLSKYIGRGLVLIFGFTAILCPVLLGIFIEPAAFFATIYFLIIGIFILWYIYGRRKTWFKIGGFNTTFASIRNILIKPASKPSREICFYTKGEYADGKKYRINLILISDVKVKSFGAMNHSTNIKSKSTSVLIPRSAKAQHIHRICSIIKCVVLLSSLIFFPLSSLFWRLITGIIAASLVTYIVLKLNSVKGKTSFLFTPSLIIKIGIWLMAVSVISRFGPGFEISLNEYKYILFTGLFFLLDMLFDLVCAAFPFYSRLFKPIVKQDKILNGLYDKGYQNYIEYPFYSVFYPLFVWIF